jgi:nucleotide-binding universal stress UspA family protein
MAFKDILVHVDSSDAGRTRLRLAADLAARHSACLTALHVREYSIDQQHRLRTAELGLASGDRTDSLKRSIETELEADAYALRALLAQLRQDCAIQTEWRTVEGHARKVVPQHSRYADLSIVGQDRCEDADLPDDYSFAETMLFTTGRPLLVIPAQASTGVAPTTLGRRIAIAWNGSRPAARALSDALPLIERAEQTTLLVAQADHLNHPDRPAPTAILDHVRRHTQHADYRALDTAGAGVGDALQAAALEAGADLLVAGAHGRARLWEKMLGSVTRDLLTRMHMPLLLAY